MFESLLTVLGAGLSIWNNKERTKYVDQLMSLKRRYYEEYNKSAEYRSDAILDGIQSELYILASAFSTSVGKSDTPNQP